MEFGDRLDGPGAPGAEVAPPAGLSATEENQVAADDVPHVGIVPPRLEDAHKDDRLPQASLDLGHLLCKVGRDEHIAPAWPFVLEGAGPANRHAVALEVLIAHQILPGLPHRERRQPAELA